MALSTQLLLAAILAVFAPLAVALVLRKKTKRLLPPTSPFPYVGVRTDQFMPWTRALLRSVTKTAENANEGYRNISLKRNLAFSLPSLTHGYLTVLPPSRLDLLNKPEADLLSHPIQMEVMQPGYLMGDPEELLFKNPIQFDVVRQHMTKDVGLFAASAAGEIQHLFSEGFSFTSEETTVNIWGFSLRIVGRVANRALIGLPLCRNETLLERSAAYANVVYLGSTLISSIPKSMRWLVGPIVGFVGRRHADACKRILEPLIEERLRAWSAADSAELPVGSIPPHF